MISVFFRNDDLRDTLDDSLVNTTEIFIENNCPITHAVEPKNVSKEVVSWLINIKKQFPDLIDIIQHGFDHNKDNLYYKQEFGGKRGYKDQYNDLRKGKEIMDNFFNDLWTPILSFPFGSYNKFTMQATKDLGYLGVTTGINFKNKARLKNKLGMLLKRETLYGRKISYHTKIRPSGVLDISTSLSIIKRYYSETDCEHYSLEEIISKIKYNSSYTNIIGILLHHRFHKNEMEMIRSIIDYIKSNDFVIKRLIQYYYE